MKNQIRIWKKLSQSGVGIVELLISAVLLGFLALAVTKLGIDTWRFQTEAVTSSEINEFSSSLGYFFKGLGCSDEFKDKEFPRGITDPELSAAKLKISNYVGWGDETGTIESGSEFAGDKWRVRNLTWIHKTSIDPQKRKRRIEEPPDSGNFEDKEYEILVAQISLQSEMKKDGSDSGSDDDYIRMTPYNVEIPFVVDPADNYKIVDCVDPDLDGQDICAVIGAEYDKENNRCKPNENCFVKTSFVNCQTHVGEDPWRDEDKEKVDNLCGKLIKPVIGDSHFVSFHNKDRGNDPGECPEGSEGILSGDVRRDQRYRCGKKCTDTAYGAGEIYLCMECKE